jgi:hypothetical protein
MSSSGAVSVDQQERRQDECPACRCVAEKAGEFSAWSPARIGLPAMGASLGNVGMPKNCTLCHVALLELS